MTPDPDIETIVGEENVVDVDATTEPASEPAGYTCSHCTFSTPALSDLEAHAAETGHGRIVQPELFSEKGIVHRMVNVMLPAELLNEKRTRLAALYQSALDIKDDKKSADDDFNARLKNIDSQMQEIARVLKTPYTYEKVECEWRIIEEENARGLYRLDTGELLDKQPLTMEDMQEEQQKAEAENATQPTDVAATPPHEEPEASSQPDPLETDASFINQRNKGRRKKARV
jgi:hypothetical protein